MPKLTVTHEAPLELIKQHPELAVDLLKAVTGMPLRARLDVRLASTSLNTVTPVQYTADSVVLVSDPDTREALAAIIVEPQGRDERTKKFAWPGVPRQRAQGNRLRECVPDRRVPGPG